MRSPAPGTVFILLFFQPAEGFDYSFLTLRSAPVFRDALHAVVQIAALGDDAGNASPVSVARAGAEAVADVNAHGEFFRGDVHLNIRVDHRDVRRGDGGDDLHLRGGGGTAGALGGLGDFRCVDVRVVAFLGGVGDHGGIFRNGHDDGRCRGRRRKWRRSVSWSAASSIPQGHFQYFQYAGSYSM